MTDRQLHDEFLRGLASVRRRLRQRSATVGASCGLVATGLCLIAATIVSAFVAQTQLPVWLGLLGLLGGTTIGGLVGAVRSPQWNETARTVDQSHDLKDEIVSALQFAEGEDVSPMHRFQIRRAMTTLNGVDARTAVPSTFPRTWPYGPAAALAAVLLSLWPIGPNDEAAARTAPDSVLRPLTEALNADIEKLEHALEDEPGPELEEIVEQLREQVRSLEADDVTQREVMATLSAMDELMAVAESKPDAARVQSQLESLGEALSVARSFKSAGRELKDNNLTQAADALEQVDPGEMTPAERRAAADAVEKVADNFTESKAKKLARKSKQLAKAFSDGDRDKIREAAKSLSQAVRDEAAKARVRKTMQRQRQRLTEKEALVSELLSQCAKCGGDCQHGKCAGQGVQQNSLSAHKSNDGPQQAKRTWGRSIDDTVFGDATQMETRRQRQELTGQIGEGSSERRMTTGAAEAESAQRPLLDKFERYRAASEAVIEQEALPLGHRQTIRRYFESIRPSNQPTDR